jgi:hypothetical protein
MSDGPDLYRLTQRTKYLWSVEYDHPARGWISVADCLLPWVDVVKAVKTTQPTSPPTRKGGKVAGKVNSPCEWCGQNPHRYLAVSDGGAQYICEVCAVDVAPSKGVQ